MPVRSAGRTAFAFALVGLVAMGPSAAATPLVEREPGLWEISLSQDSPMAAMLEGMQEALKGMPEAERKQMEQMMMQSGVTPAQPNVVRECVTADMAKGEFQPAMGDPDMQCSDVEWSGSGSEGSYALTCTDAEGQWSVKGRIRDATSKSYKSEMTMSGVVDGQTVDVKMAHDARWLGADCQGIAPRQ